MSAQTDFLAALTDWPWPTDQVLPCQTIEPFQIDVLFFNASRHALEEIEEAKALCSRCPARAACLDFAVAHDEQYGVWGGLTADERSKAGLTSAWWNDEETA